MLRTVADDTPSPAAVTSSEEATGSPDVMYSRTKAARTRRERSGTSISTLVQGLLKNYTTVCAPAGPAKAGHDKGYGTPHECPPRQDQMIPARLASSPAAARAAAVISARSTRT